MKSDVRLHGQVSTKQSMSSQTEMHLYFKTKICYGHSRMHESKAQGSYLFYSFSHIGGNYEKGLEKWEQIGN